MAWCRLCVDDSGRDDSVRMGGKSCDYLFFDELYYIFFMTRNMSRYNPREIHRRKEFQRAVHRSQVNNKGITKHKCAICGRTEKDGEHLEFRFCSKCNGNYEYCQDHLFTHTHIR